MNRATLLAMPLIALGAVGVRFNTGNRREPLFIDRALPRLPECGFLRAADDPPGCADLSDAKNRIPVRLRRILRHGTWKLFITRRRRRSGYPRGISPVE